jgi:hypothetical protein
MRRLKWGVAMILIAMAPGYALAQRGGAHASQNYRPKPLNPILNIDYQSENNWSQIRLSDLLKMKRIVVSVSDPGTNKAESYEGIKLDQVVPDISDYRVDVFRNFWAFKDKLAVSSSDLDMRFNMTVADTMNGKRLGQDHPFCLIARNNRGGLVIVRDLAYIRLGKIHEPSKNSVLQTAGSPLKRRSVQSKEFKTD